MSFHSLLAASAIYRELYATEDDFLPATFQVELLGRWG